jgi:hypothetical protein
VGQRGTEGRFNPLFPLCAIGERYSPPIESEVVKEVTHLYLQPSERARPSSFSRPTMLTTFQSKSRCRANQRADENNRQPSQKRRHVGLLYINPLNLLVPIRLGALISWHLNEIEINTGGNEEYSLSKVCFGVVHKTKPPIHVAIDCKQNRSTVLTKQWGPVHPCEH